VKEVRVLHKIMEVKRKEDVARRNMQVNSVKDQKQRSGGKEVTVFDKARPADAKVEDSKTPQYYHNMTIKPVVDINYGFLVNKMGDELGDELDVSALIKDLLWDQSEEAIKVTKGFMDKLKKNASAREFLENAPDAYLKIIYYDSGEVQDPPALPENYQKGLTDFYTMAKPRMVLEHLKNVTIENGGRVDWNLRALEATLTLQLFNAPTPVTFAVKVFRDEEHKCFLVQFKRAAGEAVCYYRSLRNLVKLSGPVLTGIDAEYGPVDQKKLEVSPEDVDEDDVDVRPEDVQVDLDDLDEDDEAENQKFPQYTAADFESNEEEDAQGEISDQQDD